MEMTTLITGLVLGLVAGVLLGALLAWLAGRGRMTAAAARVEAEVVRQGAKGAAELAAAAAERDVLRERVVDLEVSVADDAQTAATLAPLRATLDRVERQVQVLERDRVDQLAAVREVLGRVEERTSEVGREAASLASSLRVSSVRGAWGEVQLRRVLEVSGMLARCDFTEQLTGVSTTDATIRPDVVVHLPGGKHLVIDAKAPMARWLEAHAEDCDPERSHELLGRHAKDLAGHIRTLADKQYWSAFDPCPEMVVCFLPTDATLAAALARDPGLLDRALASKVVLTSPGTLLALLRTVAFAWQQDALSRNARELVTLGRDLHQRLGTLGQRTEALGRSLRKSVEAYNALVGTLESRVLVTARRMTDLGVVAEELPEPAPVEATPRVLTAPELLESVAEADARPEIDTELAGAPRPRASA